MSLKLTKKFHKDIDFLRQEASASVDMNQLMFQIRQTEKLKFIGILRNSEELNDIEAARKFSPTSAFYGNKYGKSVAAFWDIRSNSDPDLYCTDEDGILKNEIHGESAKARIRIALQEKRPVVFFFGGSTMMSMGAKTPNFSIPSLVERISDRKHGRRIECINFGLGGTCSRDALNLLIHKSAKFGKPNAVVFYDGWNCASYLSNMELLLQNANALAFETNLSYGEGVRQFEYNLTLSEIYSPYWCFARYLKLILASFFSTLYRRIPSVLMKRITIGVQNRLFSLRPHNKFVSLLSKAQKNISDVEISMVTTNAVKEYVALHKSAQAICLSQGIEFFWFQQPLVFWGNKCLTQSELEWKNYYSFGNSKFYDFFEKVFTEKFKNTDYLSKDINFYDLTKIFDEIPDQLYIDSGHLNRLGNLIVSGAICEVLSEVDGGGSDVT